MPGLGGVAWVGPQASRAAGPSPARQATGVTCGNSALLHPIGATGSRRRDRIGLMKVYTRTGDDGTTGLFYGGRVAKDGAGPEAYGTTDEVVSALGLARAECEPESELGALLVRLQRELFVVGAERRRHPTTGTSSPTARRGRRRDGRGAGAGHRRRVRAVRSAAGVRAARRDRVAAALDVARTTTRRARARAFRDA